MLNGMANLYVANPDFHTAFGGPEAADFAAQALRLYAQRHRPS